jgi:hypothetical protein
MAELIVLQLSAKTLGAPPMRTVDRESLLEAIRSAVGAARGARITRGQFLASSGLKVSDVFRHFPKWTDAITAAGFAFDGCKRPIDPEKILTDWALLARKQQRIPTRNEYDIEGRYSTGVFDRNFGSWAAVPSAFRQFAGEQTEWSDVIALLPVPETTALAMEGSSKSPLQKVCSTIPGSAKLANRRTYGDPVDFRGLRHAPVNEDGVIFLFGMVAKELGYLVESIQGGFPDCEAKRPITSGQWQRVRIEFEFESRNFRDHGHSANDCDVIVCWAHNWPECPAHLEIVELSRIIQHLADAAD